MNSKFALAISALAILAVPFDAAAVPLTYTFTGTVNYVSGSGWSGGTFALGHTVSGAFTYGTSAVDTDPGNPNSGIYAAGATSIAFSSGYAATSLASQVRVTDPDDGFNVYAGSGHALTGAVVGGLGPSQLSVNLVDTTAAIFSSDALPLFLPPFSAFNQNSGAIFFGGQLVAFGITSLDLVETSAPAPAAGGMLALGLALLTWRRNARAADSKPPVCQIGIRKPRPRVAGV